LAYGRENLEPSPAAPSENVGTEYPDRAPSHLISSNY
jgi:hypothetical protein